MYCNFEYTGDTFNKKKVYKCRDCGITLGLEDPSIQILCFRQQQKLAEASYQQRVHEAPMNVDLPHNADLAKFAEQDLIRRSLEKEDEDNPENLCTETEIASRLAICNGCEHYQDNACLLCGCRIVREANYQNKLAHKNASCPIQKWGPIDQNL